MWNALIVVWRESLEALLIIGVLLSWIARQEETDALTLRRGLWVGVAGGIAAAAALGMATWLAQSEIAVESLDQFQTIMILFASGLILQMVLWMHAHGRYMRREIEQRAQAVTGVWGIGMVAALAVAREGAETVIFLYGLGMEGALSTLLMGAGTGFVMAMASGWLLWRGALFLNVRTLMRTSEILLLLIATSLLVAGTGRMIAMEWLPPLLDPLWDISSVLDDGTGFGRFLADFTGYRARPAAVQILAVMAFWSFAFWKMRQSDDRQN